MDVNTIWTGSDDGLVYITRDGGKNWKNITPQGMPDFIRISMIDASPHKPGTAYVAAKNYQADDRRPYAYRTDDYGATWTKIVNGIAPRRLRARGPRRSRSARGCSSPEQSTGFMFRSIMARNGRRSA